MRRQYPVSISCGVLEVSASGYFNWLRRRESGQGGAARRHSDEALLAHMQASLVKDALAMAWWRRRPKPGLIFHSDRGSQYCSGKFQDALKDWGMRSSMSRKGNCWENKRNAVSRPQGKGKARHNAPTESLWGRLQTASVHGHQFATRE